MHSMIEAGSLVWKFYWFTRKYREAALDRFFGMDWVWLSLEGGANFRWGPVGWRLGLT